MEFKYKNILVCGLGKSGLASVELALEHGIECTMCDGQGDFIKRPEVERLIDLGAKFCHVDDLYMSNYDLAVMSPGISPEKRIFIEAEKSSRQLMGELDFASLFMPATKFYAITGTNGKTTAVMMAEFALKKLGINALACGNIGLALAEVALRQDHPDVAIVEISSYQIDLLKCISFEAGVILNITEDHIDRYGTFAKYYASKLRLANFCEVFLCR